MWIKSATILGFNKKFKFLFEKLADRRFKPVGELDLYSCGWAPVREDELSFSAGGQTLMLLVQQKKAIPGSVIADVLAAKVIEVTEAQGFAPGKKARKELKERVIYELLPRAFAPRTKTRVWIDAINGRIVIDSMAQSVIDAVQRELTLTFGDIGMEDVTWPRAAVLTAWLKEPPSEFTIDDEVTMQWPGEHGKTVRYAAADLYSDDVQQNLAIGAVVQQLAMTYDGRVSFVMSDSAQIRRIKALDVITSASQGAEVDAFENDFTLMTLELGRLIDTLIAEA